MQRRNRGITLIALVVTIILLIILATIGINAIFNDNGIIARATKTKDEYNMSKARETLVLVLGDAGIEKVVNKKQYNQDEFLDEFIRNSIENVKIQGDVVIVDGYAFEIDRGVPKIGKYVGKGKDLVFPKISTSVEVADDAKTATITITVKEEINGISKIEIIQDGFVLKEYIYDDEKLEITETYTAKQNGKYTIKVYSKLTGTDRVEVNELISKVEYSPNGSTEYRKEYNVKVSAKEVVEKVKDIKYQWTNTTVEPELETFTGSCNNGETISKTSLTGKWYLWTLLETERGKTNIGRSEAFLFDNTGPEVTLASEPVSESSFTLTATAHEGETEIAKYEFYVDDKLVKTVETSEETATCNVIDIKTGDSYSCYLLVYDKLGNKSETRITSRTQLYYWELYNTSSSYEWEYELVDTSLRYWNPGWYFTVWLGVETNGDR